MSALYLVTVDGASRCATLEDLAGVGAEEAHEVRALLPDEGTYLANVGAIERMLLSRTYTLEMIRLGVAWEGASQEALDWAVDRGLCEWDERLSCRRLTPSGVAVLDAARAHLEECARRVT